MEAVKSGTRMAVIPTMMILYTNDAVDVRYSDGSLLQLSPCGSSMFHQDPSSDLPSHPLAGAQGVQKWTQFVTSAHKTKVLQAVDFRNRFATRPFLCPSLMAPEDIVSLYARIDQIAWGRTMEESHIEVFEDGSRRAVSLDEYASLVLSPHGQDFTVCYLSRISPDPVSTNVAQHSSSPEEERGVSFTTCPVSAESSPRSENDREKVEDKNPTHSEPVSFDNLPAACQKAAQTPSSPHSAETVLNRNCNNSTPVNVVPVCEDTAAEDASGLILADGTVSTPGRTSGQHGDLQSSAFSVQHDISSISRVSSPDGLRGMVECDDTLTLNEDAAVKPSADILHSSPLSQATQSCTGQGNSCMDAAAGCTDTADKAHGETEAAAQNQSLQSKSGGSAEHVMRVMPTVRDVEDPASGHSGVNSESRGTHSALSTKNVCAEKAEKTPQSGKEPAPEQALMTQSSTANPPHVCASQIRTGEGKVSIVSQSHDKAPQVSSRKDRRSNSSGAHRGDNWSGSRQHYTWVTQHISCNACPPAWRHPLRLLQQTDPTDSVLASECNLTVSTNIAKGLHNKSGGSGGITSDADVKKKRVLSSVVFPVPLTCPFQHLHQWQDHQGQDDPDPSAVNDFQQGQLKVLMMEGVVYRFIDVAKLKTVEIYPGDGSVLVSQGTTASYFSHLVWKNSKLEEKTYSVKMLPPKPAKAPYSLPNLIKRAHRLLTGCIHNSKLAEREDLPCWKRAVTQVVEPLSASLLEECCVAAYGRFQAFSNGRVRVVFEDRTSLDMTADFSQRLQGCVKHSSVSQVSMEETLAAVKLASGRGQPQSSQCRLLLPSGKYVMVEVHKPGPYRRYVDAAKEWIQWVQSSPKERRQFYQDKATPHSARLSAEAELKKIECFNYIVDHSAISSAWVQQAASSLAALASQPPPLSTALQPSSLHSAVHCQSSRLLAPIAPAPTLPQRPTGCQSAPHHHSLGHSVASAPHHHSLGHSVASLPHHSHSITSVPHHSITSVPHPSLGHSVTSVPHHHSLGHSVTLVPHHSVTGSAPPGFSASSSFLISDPKDLDLLQGFNSVKEALLRTSQMIREIDDIVKDRKESGSAQ